MKFTTPAIASLPYRDEAPSFSTSMRSIAEIRMLFTSTAVLVVPPKTATRRPFTRMRVRVAPRARSEMVDWDVVTVPFAWLTWMLPALVAAVMEWSNSSVVLAAILSMSSRRMTCTGSAVSPSMRLIEDPVTSTRSPFWTSVCARTGNATSDAIVPSSAFLMAKPPCWPAMLGARTCRQADGLRYSREAMMSPPMRRSAAANLRRCNRSKPAGALEVEIAIHEGNREGFRERFHQHRPRCLHPLRRGRAVALVHRAGGIAKRALQVLHGLGADAIERCLAKVGKEHQVLALEEGERGKQRFLVLIEQVREDHDERAALEPLRELHGRGMVIGRSKRGLRVVEGVQEGVQRRARLARRHEARLGVGEGHESRGIALAQRHVGKEQHGVQDLVEVRKSGVARHHPPPAVDEEHDLLVALVLVLARDEPAAPRRRLPVDLAHRVALAIFAKLVELQARAAPATAQHADVRQPVLDREERVVGHLGEVGVAAQHLRGSHAHRELPQAERRGDARFGGRENEGAALGGAHAIARLSEALARHGEREGQAFDLDRGGRGGVNPGAGREGPADLQRHHALASAADGQRARHETLQLQARPYRARGKQVRQQRETEDAERDLPRGHKHLPVGGDGAEGDEDRGDDERRARRHRRLHRRGASTCASISASTESASRPSISSSGATATRWRITASATDFTSSGVANVRPDISARARALRTSAIEARGPAPRESPWLSRVARASFTA